jgi:hypothetical protein
VLETCSDHNITAPGPDCRDQGLQGPAYLDYNRKIGVPLNYWRTTSQIEVDFLVGEAVGIEVKSRSADLAWRL